MTRPKVAGSRLPSIAAFDRGRARPDSEFVHPVKWLTTWRLLSGLSLGCGLISAPADEVTGRPAGAGAGPPLTVAEPSATNRLVAGALLWPKQARPNEWVTFFVKVRLAPGFHIYALDHSGRATMPSKIIDTLPEALRPQGSWWSTAPKALEDGSRVLTGEVLFQRRLRLSPAAQPGTNLVAVELQFQICNEAACWPPDKARLKSEFEVLSSKP